MLAGLAASGVKAAPLTMTELNHDNALLTNFNLVTLGNLNFQNGRDFVAGRTIVGGNLNIAPSAQAGVCYGACRSGQVGGVDSSTAMYGAMTVFGSIVGTSNTYAWTGNGSGSPWPSARCCGRWCSRRVGNCCRPTSAPATASAGRPPFRRRLPR